jgi:hypothetical protein
MLRNTFGINQDSREKNHCNFPTLKNSILTRGYHTRENTVFKAHSWNKFYTQTNKYPLYHCDFSYEYLKYDKQDQQGKAAFNERKLIFLQTWKFKVV